VVTNGPSASDEEWDFRPITESDVPLLRLINNDAYPAVPRATGDEMVALVDNASWGLVATRGEDIAGFVLCFDPGVNYASENYRYFESHFDSHFYIDRIVIAKPFRGAGLGVSLYEAVFEEAKKRGAANVTCEVNLDPPNPVSIAFHRRMGFGDVGTQDTKGGSVLVQLMAAPVVG
jgi:predicted GNAT superfamily acetyltransferase